MVQNEMLVLNFKIFDLALIFIVMHHTSSYDIYKFLYYPGELLDEVFSFIWLEIPRCLYGSKKNKLGLSWAKLKLS